jgi:type II secretion system protein D
MKRLLIILFFACCASAMAQKSTVESKEPMVTLQYPNNSISDILDVYERLTGLNVVRDANMGETTLRIVSQDAVPKSEAIRLIEASLLLNGYALVQIDSKTVKAINIASGKQPRSEGIALYAHISDLPKGEIIASYLMPLKYLTSAEALPIFQQHIQLHSYGSIIAVPSRQALLITENASVIRRMTELQSMIDLPPAATRMEFIQLKRANVDRVVEFVQKFWDKRKQTSGEKKGNEADASSDIQLIPDARTNRILLVTPPAQFELIKRLIEQFDEATPMMEPFERPLLYAKASEVLPVLQSMLQESDGSKESAPEFSNKQVTTPTSSTSTQTTGNAQDKLAAPSDDLSPTAVTVGKTRLIADKHANSIIVFGPPESVEKAKAVLDLLDKRTLQIYLDTVIGQLTLQNDSEVGLDVLQRYAHTGNAGIATSLRNRSGSSDTVPGVSSLLSNGAFPLPTGLTLYGTIASNIDAYLKLLATSSRFKVLSRPSIYTTNNKKAVILSGQKIAVPTSTLSNLNTGTTNNVSVTANIQYEDVVLKLEVIPQINTDHEIMLQIDQQNDNVVGSQVISGNTIPTIGTQEINTTVTVADGSTVILGGLITENNQKNDTGVPILKDIPVLGYLFKDETTSKQRSELVVMLQPHVIASDEDLERTQALNREREVLGKLKVDSGSLKKRDYN